MSFNVDKCVVMHIGQRNINHTYTMNGTDLKTTVCEKDVGVYIQPSLKPSVYIVEALKKANQALGVLLKTLTFRDKFHYIRLYQQQVRCHLEYAVHG